MGSEFDDPELRSGFFADVEESFYPQVSQGTGLIRSGSIREGVDMMMRPLHTIKGTSAFLGMPEISAFTHRVEDYLKAVQSGARAGSPDLLVQAVDTVFAALEQARGGQGLPAAEMGALVEKMAQPDAASPAAGAVEVLRRDGVAVIRVLAPRVHLPGQFRPLQDALAGLEAGTEALLDLEGVRTLGSTAWGAIHEAATRVRLSVAGMGEACRATFYSWGFNRSMAEHASAAAFFEQRRS